MHFEHSFTVPNEKNACIRPQRGVYMHLHGTAFLFRDTFYYYLLYRKSPILKQHG